MLFPKIAGTVRTRHLELRCRQQGVYGMKQDLEYVREDILAEK
jgi:hypothetical protein